MTNTEIIQTIRKEIINRIDKRHLSVQAKNELVSILSFLSTLKSENPMNQDELEDEIERIVKCEEEFMNFKFKSQLIAYVARHFAQWGAEHFRDTTKMISGSSEIPNDLEEAASEYKERVIEETKCHHNALTYAEGYEDALLLIPDAFIAGAKWQKQHDAELIEIVYNDGITIGMTKQKELMMQGAVEGEVTKDNRGNNVVRAGVFNKDFEYGDKVRIIIVKED